MVTRRTVRDALEKIALFRGSGIKKSWYHYRVVTEIEKPRPNRYDNTFGVHTTQQDFGRFMLLLKGIERATKAGGDESMSVEILTIMQPKYLQYVGRQSKCGEAFRKMLSIAKQRMKSERIKKDDPFLKFKITITRVEMNGKKPPGSVWI